MSSTRHYGSAGVKPSVGTVADHASDSAAVDDDMLAAQARSMPGGPGGGGVVAKNKPASGGMQGFGDPDVPSNGRPISYKGMKNGLALLDSIMGSANGAIIMGAMFALQMDALKNRSFARKEAFMEGMNKIAVVFEQAAENIKLIDEQKSLAQEKYSNAMVGAWCQIIGGGLQAICGGVQAGTSGSMSQGLGTIGGGLGTVGNGLNSFYQAQSAGADANSGQWEMKKNVEKLNVRKAQVDMAAQQADQAKDDANEHLKSVKDLAQKIWASKVDNMNKANIGRG